jgi:hypothetical protein
MRGLQPGRLGRFALGAACLAGALLAPGCGRGRGDITGKVTLNNEPIPWGRVHFVSEGGNNEILHSPIVNGQYSIEKCPTGPVKIAVESFRAPGKPGAEFEMAKGFKAMMKDRAEGPPVEVAGKHVPIPERYADAEQSGLTYDVQAGPQTHDIPLSP